MDSCRRALPCSHLCQLLCHIRIKGSSLGQGHRVNGLKAIDNIQHKQLGNVMRLLRHARILHLL